MIAREHLLAIHLRAAFPLLISVALPFCLLLLHTSQLGRQTPTRSNSLLIVVQMDCQSFGGLLRSTRRLVAGCIVVETPTKSVLVTTPQYDHLRQDQSK